MHRPSPRAPRRARPLRARTGRRGTGAAGPAESGGGGDAGVVDSCAPAIFGTSGTARTVNAGIAADGVTGGGVACGFRLREPSHGHRARRGRHVRRRHRPLRFQRCGARRVRRRGGGWRRRGGRPVCDHRGGRRHGLGRRSPGAHLRGRGARPPRRAGGGSHRASPAPRATTTPSARGPTHFRGGAASSFSTSTALMRCECGGVIACAREAPSSSGRGAAGGRD